MITRTSKLSQEALSEIGQLALRNLMLLNGWIPGHSNVENVVKMLRDEKDAWSVLTGDRPLAIFRLDIHEKQASLQGFCPIDEGAGSLQETISVLRNEIFEMGATEVRVEVPKTVSEPFVLNGFEKDRDLVRLSGRPIVMKMMPILRLSNVTESAIPDLSKLLYEAYEGSSEKKFPSVKTAESSLQEIMRGQHGRYASNASFLSGSQLNIVSACLITLGEGNLASVAELFTHPLYRARGLATTELAAAMNWLVQNKVDVLTAWVRSSNDVARRLFAKIGFKEEKQLVELVVRDNSPRNSKATG
jgi:ribosomal protein S18 acetylase RimI-like enzyme